MIAPRTRRWLPAALLLALAALVVGGACTGPATPREAPPTGKEPPAPAKAASGESCPMFGCNPQRNPVNLTAKNVPTDWSVGDKPSGNKGIKWSAEFGDYAYAGPVIADGKVFVGTGNSKPRDPNVKGDKGVVMCFNEADGKFLWQAVHDKEDGNIDSPGAGIASTPAVDGKRVYYLDNRGELICATTEGLGGGKNEGVTDEQHKGKNDADVVWRLDLAKLGVVPHQHPASSPLVVGDLVFVGTSNGVTLGKDAVENPKAPSFIAVDKKTGEIKWQDSSPGDKILLGQWGSPAYAEVNGKGQVIFPGGDGWLYSFEPATGKLIWKFDCNPKASEWNPDKGSPTRNFLLSAPCVADNKVYVGVGRDPDAGTGIGHLWCIDITKTGDVSPVGDNFDPKAEVNKNSALVWHYGGKLDKPKEGRKFVFGRTMSTCCVHDGLVFAAEIGGFLHCLDAKTGTPNWVYDLGEGEVWASPVWIDGKVWIGTVGRKLEGVPAAKELKEDAVVTIDVGGAIRTPVAMVNGTLFVQTDNNLFAIGPK
jgi:outer membrane protein assembly factor BamB